MNCFQNSMFIVSFSQDFVSSVTIMRRASWNFMIKNTGFIWFSLRSVVYSVSWHLLAVKANCLYVLNNRIYSLPWNYYYYYYCGSTAPC
jgi:hypothetical protein